MMAEADARPGSAPAGNSVTSASLLGRLAQDPTDQAAWQEFVGRYAPKIYAWCRAWGLQDADAQDATQDVLLRLSAQMRRFRYDPSRRFRGWLRGVAHHVWVELISGRRKAGVAGGGEPVAALIDAEQARDDLARRLEAEFYAELLDEASRRVRCRVAPRTWEAFRLTAIEGCSGAEAAERLGMEVATVYVARSNVQKRLREEVKLLEEAF